MTPSVGPLSVTADLSVSVDGARVVVDGYGDLVVVDAPSFRAVRRFAGGRAGTRLLAGLAAADVAVDVRVRGTSVARVDPDAPPGALSRLLGAAPARVSAGGVAFAALGRIAKAVRGCDAAEGVDDG